jgi:hypothetical protein
MLATANGRLPRPDPACQWHLLPPTAVSKARRWETSPGCLASREAACDLTGASAVSLPNRQSINPTVRVSETLDHSGRSSPHGSRNLAVEDGVFTAETFPFPCWPIMIRKVDSSLMAERCRVCSQPVPSQTAVSRLRAMRPRTPQSKRNFDRVPVADLDGPIPGLKLHFRS